jgi:hypothetical protein
MPLMDASMAYVPIDLQGMPCVVYLHSQGGNRIEGKYLVERCADIGVALCLFDFVGSGHSSGEFVGDW